MTYLKKHELIDVPTDDIKLDPTNPNQMSQKQMASLKQSMQRWGYLTPVILDQNNQICDGEHRYLVYKQLGYKTIPAYKLTLEDDSERLLIRQVMNKLHGEHDRQLDSNELATIFERNSNQLVELSELIAQRKEELQYLIGKYHPEIWFEGSKDFNLEKSLEEIVPTVQLGDMYQLDNHRLICGDCTDSRIIDRLLEDKKVAQLNTDPPYGVEYDTKNEFYVRIHHGENHIKTGYFNDEYDQDYKQIFLSVFKNVESYWADYNTFYIWSAGYRLHEIRTAMQESNNIHWGDYLVWVKNNHVLGRKDYNAQHEFAIYGWYNRHKFYPETSRTTVLNYNKPHVNDLHPTMKPIELIRQTIEDGSKQGDNILDLFTGSGTALMACEASDRNFFGVEIDPHYCDVIIKRWEDYTGKQAVRLT